MIKGIFHEGSGLGNQLHRYIGTKVIALERGETHTMIAPELFKGKDFLKLDIEPNDIKYRIEYPSGEVIPESYEDVIDEEFQGTQYFIKHIDKVKEWLKPDGDMIAEMNFKPEHCVISFRGGEYKYVPELFLPQEYWDLAIQKMKDRGINRFFVVTDDVEEAHKFFPDFQITHDVANDWYAISVAPNLILSNSSFAILPACLGSAKHIIAPKYWARYNTKEWINPDNATYNFNYIHHDENI